MDPNELIALYRAGGWVPLTAWLGHTLVRLMKSDTKLPIDVPRAWRPYVAIAISVALAIVQHRFAGTGGTWGQAVGFGVVAGGMAIVAHLGLVDWLRDGREMPVPGLMKPTEDEKPKPPSVPPLALLMLGLVRLGIGVLVVSALGCSLFRPARNGSPPPAQAVVLYTAKAVQVANTACVQAADSMTVRASMDADTDRAIETAKKAKALALECKQLTITARAALEAVEHLVETGGAIVEKDAGCAVKRGLDAAADICTAMRSAHVGTCPALVDSAFTFGSPLLSAVGACPLKEKP